MRAGSPAPRSLVKTKFSRAAALLIMLLALAAAIFILVRDAHTLFREPLHLNLGLCGLAVLVAAGGLLVVVAAWRQILVACGVSNSFRSDLRVYCYSALGFALPGGIWPLLGRSTLYHAAGFDGLRVAGASVIEALVTGLAAMAIYGIGTAIQPGLSLWQRPELGFAGVLLAGLALHPRVFRSLSNLALRRARPGGGPAGIEWTWIELLRWLALEGMALLIGSLALFVLLNSTFHAQAELLPRMVTAWAAASAASNLLFWLPGTAVLRDGVLVIALTPALPLASAVAFTILVRIWMIVSFLAIAVVVWLLIDRRWPIVQA